MSEPVRIIYHPAPGPDRNGNIVVPSPVRLGSDVPLAMRWVRRRLGLRPYGQLIEACRFTEEILPLSDPSEVRVTTTTTKKKGGRTKKGRAAALVAPAPDLEALSFTEADIASAQELAGLALDDVPPGPVAETPVSARPAPLSSFEGAPDLPADLDFDLEGGTFEAPVLD